MKELLSVIIVVAILLFLAPIFRKNRKNRTNKRNNPNTIYDYDYDIPYIPSYEEFENSNIPSVTETPITPEYHGKYQKRLLLTKNEWYEYRKLKELAARKGYQICPKVRLLDLIEPRRGDPKYKTYFYKIQAKHVDFVICDQNLYVKAILELDDNSHNQTNRHERDEFVDLILKDVGYTVIRVRSITNNALDSIS